MTRFSAAALVLLLAGCGQNGCQSRRGADGTVAPSAQSAAAPEPVGPNARVGVVYGRILLAEGATLPRVHPTEIDRGPERPELPANCGPARDTDTLPVEGVGTPTALNGIMITATGEEAAFMRALGQVRPVDRTVRIERCRLNPKMLTATVGDTLVIQNDSRYAFLPSAGPDQFHETLLPNQNRRVALDHTAVSFVRCLFSYGCGRTDLVVLKHPVHTVSDVSGRYELRYVPADLDVQLHAWHPRFQETTAVTRVRAGERVELDLVLRPLDAPGQPPAAPPAPAPAPEAPAAPAAPTAPR